MLAAYWRYFAYSWAIRDSIPITHWDTAYKLEATKGRVQTRC